MPDLNDPIWERFHELADQFEAIPLPEHTKRFAELEAAGERVEVIALLKRHLQDPEVMARTRPFLSNSKALTVDMPTSDSKRFGEQIGPYTLISELGQGTFGTVWLAENRGELATTQVALKLPHAATLDLDALRNEAKSWAATSQHPNVLTVFEARVYNGQVVIVSEYAAGGTLKHWLARHGGTAPSFADVVAIAEGILKGLGHLHQQGIIHRDLKLANILLKGGLPVLGDFGLARFLASPDSGLIAGTPAYMAPEAFDGVRDKQTDLWSIGVVLYELIMGTRPCASARGLKVLEVPALLPNTPLTLVRVISRALQCDRTSRYESADEMLRDLGSQDAVILQQHRRRLEQRYGEVLLKACDLLDLHNLPVEEMKVALQKILLRQLFAPLKVRIVSASLSGNLDGELEAAEGYRDWQRHLTSSRNRRPDPINSYREHPVGDRLTRANRLVVLGDPGSGKSTLLRWIATAYLLRFRGDPDVQDLPGVATLPEGYFLPILLRCRELVHVDLKSWSLGDLLEHVLRKTELSDQNDVLCTVLRDRLRDGSAILLIDGLDEFQDRSQAVALCRTIEQVGISFPKALIVVTSRIVGYREMGYRMGTGFEHVMLTDLEAEEKEDFIRRWCAVTETEDTRDIAARELILALHKVEAIKRLTGNPLLLTTLALVKRKIGKLPNRRVELYEEAVSVLLNWRHSDVSIPLESSESLPQLEYLAYEMCRQGVQRLPEDEALDLLTQMRIEFPHLRRVKDHRPEDFLRLLEQRTAILIQAGYERRDGIETPVYEFRHLTFQEFLAGRAIRYGRYATCKRGRPLAERVSALAGITSTHSISVGGRLRPETTVAPHWQEPIRLCLADLDLEGVDEAITALLKPLSGEDSALTVRPRAILAAACLMDEPNVTSETAETVLGVLAHSCSEFDAVHERPETALDDIVTLLSHTEWREPLRLALLREFCSRTDWNRCSAGLLACQVRQQQVPSGATGWSKWSERIGAELCSANELEVVGACLDIMALASQRAFVRGDGMSISNDVAIILIRVLRGTRSEQAAAIWALGVLSGGYKEDEVNPRTTRKCWHPNSKHASAISDMIGDHEADRFAVTWAIEALTKCYDTTGTPAYFHEWMLVADGRGSKLPLPKPSVIADMKTLGVLYRRLHDSDWRVCHRAALALGRLGVDALKNTVPATPETRPSVGSVTAHWIAMLVDARVSTNIWLEAACHLGWSGDTRAAAPLVKAFKEFDNVQSSHAFLALVGLADVGTLAELFNDKQIEATKRAAFANALACCGGDAAFVTLLDALHKGQEHIVRHAILEALKGMAQRSQDAVLSRTDKWYGRRDNRRREHSKEGYTRGASWVVRRLLGCLSDKDRELRLAVLSILAEVISLNETDKRLLSRDLNGRAPWIDPASWLNTVSNERLKEVSLQLKMSVEEARDRYRKLAKKLHIDVGPKPGRAR